MNPPSLPFSGLTDEEFMLALCVHPERLSDPDRWCREMRELAAATDKGPATSGEADQLMAWAERLRIEAEGGRV